MVGSAGRVRCAGGKRGIVRKSARWVDFRGALTASILPEKVKID